VRLPYRSGWHSASGRLLTMPHSVAQWREVSGAVAGHDSEAHSGVDSPLTRMPAGVSALNAPAGGAGMGGRPVMPSSETETCSRGRLALDRDGASREGGGGRPAPERDKAQLEGAIDPRARRICSRRCRTPRADQSSARGWLGRLSDGPWARRFVLCACLGLFVFVFYEFKRVFPGCLGDLYGCPRQ
jgi:hypothetical protein